MAFVAEDGTGLETANALTDVAFADDYFTDRNIAAWTGTTVVKQAALIKATDYIETRFGSLFYGDKKSTTQALSHPRANTTTGEFPVALKRAVCEYAVRSLTATLLPDPEIHASGQGLERTRSTIAITARMTAATSPPAKTMQATKAASIEAESAVRNHPLMMVRTPEIR